MRPPMSESLRRTTSCGGAEHPQFGVTGSSHRPVIVPQSGLTPMPAPTIGGPLIRSIIDCKSAAIGRRPGEHARPSRQMPLDASRRGRLKSLELRLSVIVRAAGKPRSYHLDR